MRYKLFSGTDGVMQPTYIYICNIYNRDCIEVILYYVVKLADGPGSTILMSLFLN